MKHKKKKGSPVITVCGLYYSVPLNLPEKMGTDNLFKTSVFVKRRQSAKIATYFAFCASYFNKLVHMLYYKAVNLARSVTMSAGYSKT